MATTVANLSTTAYVKVNSEKHSVLLQSLRDTVRIVFSDAQPTTANSVFHTLDGSDRPLQLTDLDTDVWALATTDRTSLVITEFQLQTIHMYPPIVDLQTGYFANLEPGYACGEVIHVDAADSARTVWSFADNIASPRSDRKVFPTTGGDFFIASDNAADTSIEFTCTCIAANGDALTLVATTDATDGRTPVQFGSGLDINFVFQSGTNQTCAGEVYFTNLNDFTLGEPNTVTSVLAHVPVTVSGQGFGVSPQAFVRVPNNKEIIIKEFFISVSRDSGAAGSAIVHCKVTRPNGSEVVAREWHMQTGTVLVPATSMVFGAGTIIEMVLEDVSDTNTNCGIEMHFTFREV